MQVVEQGKKSKFFSRRREELAYEKNRVSKSREHNNFLQNFFVAERKTAKYYSFHLVFNTQNILK